MPSLNDIQKIKTFIKLLGDPVIQNIGEKFFDRLHDDLPDFVDDVDWDPHYWWTAEDIGTFKTAYIDKLKHLNENIRVSHSEENDTLNYPEEKSAIHVWMTATINYHLKNTASPKVINNIIRGIIGDERVIKAVSANMSDSSGQMLNTFKKFHIAYSKIERDKYIQTIKANRSFYTINDSIFRNIKYTIIVITDPFKTESETSIVFKYY